ncbi:MAG TPA: RNA 2',3'-cyclic phosphodiesterase [Candidatus Saccharimonadales bacterium]|nr:RNA 2',3'-cyclic phosphodiesterase [Candidatus Saccharimonadales bacterium]
MRLFVAVDIPGEIKEKLWEAAKAFELKGVILSKKENYHVTLQFLGEVDESRLQGVKDALSSVKAEGFGVTLSGISTFDATLRVIFAEVKAGSEELRKIYSQIDAELAKKGIRYEAENSYKPHVTLARVKFAKDKTPIPPLIRKYSSYDFGRFKARAIVLKVSRPSGSGYVYENIHKVELR